MPPRYVYVLAPSHPLSPPSGQIPEHRKLLYDRIGPGPHPCNWCGVLVDWALDRRTGGDALLTDHVDGNGRNNTQENLVPSCNPCNTRRGHDRRMEGQLILGTKRGRKVAVERTCGTCGDTFPVAKTNIESSRDVTKGAYCSRSCLNAANAKKNAEKDKANSDALAAKMWELRGQGLSYRKIADVLTSEGTAVSRSLVYIVMKRTDPVRHAAAREAREADLEALHVVRNGVRHKAVQRTCDQCGEKFLIVAAALRQTKTKGRFCSRACHYASRKPKAHG